MYKQHNRSAAIKQFNDVATSPTSPLAAQTTVTDKIKQFLTPFVVKTPNETAFVRAAPEK
jgi:hypothetical protein